MVNLTVDFFIQILYNLYNKNDLKKVMQKGAGLV